MSYSKQQVDENTDYKAGHAISLEDRMISVKYDSTLCLNSEGALSVVNSGSSGGSSDDYIAGKGIQINNNAINANVDGSTIKVNDKNQLEVINGGGGGDGKEYKAGKALNLNTDATFDVKVDDSTIKVNDKNELTVPQPTIPSYSAGQALSLDANNKFDVNVDGTTIKVNGNQLTVPQPTIPTYTAGQALSLDANNKFDVNVDGTTIKVNGNQLTVPQPNIPTYTAGQALTLDASNKFDVSIDGTTIKLNEQNQLTAINEGKTYTAGDGIEIEATTIKARIDGTTIKCENGVLNVPQPTIPTYTAGQALTLDDSHKFNVSIDGSTIKVNDKNQLEAINGGGSSYKAGDGISINNDTISVNQDWSDIKDSVKNPKGTLQFQKVDDTVRLCVVDVKYSNLVNDQFFTQTLVLTPEYEIDFNKSIEQQTIEGQSFVEDSSPAIKYLLSITDIPENINLIETLPDGTSEAEFLRIHLPSRITNEHGKPIETVICSAKCEKENYTCDIECLQRINVTGEFLNVTEKDELDMPNAIFHFKYDKHRKAFKDVVVVQLQMQPEDFAYKTYSFMNFKQPLGKVSYTIPHIHKIESEQSNIYWTVDYIDNYDKPGIMSSHDFDIKNALLRGELMIDVIYDRTNIKTNNVIKCREINADNCFKLYKSPLIFLYDPQDFGMETIDSINYWYIDFGYAYDSDEFEKLPNNQPFEFIDNKKFGLHYDLQKKSVTQDNTAIDKWTGNNVFYHIKEDVNPIKRYDELIMYISVIVSKNDRLWFVLNRYWGINNTQELHDNMTLSFRSNSGVTINNFETSKYSIIETDFDYNGDKCDRFRFELADKHIEDHKANGE